MLKNLSGQTQLILLAVVLGILFFAVRANHKRNRRKRQERHERGFGKRLEKHIKQKEGSPPPSDS